MLFFSSGRATAWPQDVATEAAASAAQRLPPRTIASISRHLPPRTHVHIPAYAHTERRGNKITSQTKLTAGLPRSRNRSAHDKPASAPPPCELAQRGRHRVSGRETNLQVGDVSWRQKVLRDPLGSVHAHAAEGEPVHDADRKRAREFGHRDQHLCRGQAGGGWVAA